MFCKAGVFKNSAKITGNHVCQSLFFEKVADWVLQLYLKRDSGACVFLCILWNSQEHLFHRTPQMAVSAGCFCFITWRVRRAQLFNRNSHRKCFLKRVFLKISQNVQENTCASLFFNKVADVSFRNDPLRSSY